MIAHFCNPYGCNCCQIIDLQSRVNKLEEENIRLQGVIHDLQRRGRAFRQPVPGSAYDLPRLATRRLYGLKSPYEP